MGQRKVYILCNYFCTISFLAKNLLVKLNYLYTQYAWISIRKNKVVTKMLRLKRWWYLSKLLTVSITSFNFFNCSVKLKSNLKLHNFKIKRGQEARHNQIFFQNVPNNEIFEVYKMFRDNSWVNVYYTKNKLL